MYNFFFIWCAGVFQECPQPGAVKHLLSGDELLAGATLWLPKRFEKNLFLFATLLLFHFVTHRKSRRLIFQSPL